MLIYLLCLFLVTRVLDKECSSFEEGFLSDLKIFSKPIAPAVTGEKKFFKDGGKDSRRSPFLIQNLRLVECSSSENLLSSQLEELEGRLKGSAIYRAQIPPSWIRVPLESDAYLHDTTLPIAIFTFDGIHLTIHNFPTQKIEESVAPDMQAMRWQKQFDSLEAAKNAMTAVAHGGFAGLVFEASGVLKGQRRGVIGMAMQIAPQHYRALSLDPYRERRFRQMRADYTIKAVGPVESLEKHKEEIISFAESFELIDEIPFHS